MNLTGWSSVPEGHGAALDTERVPVWLRVWLRVPLVDRFCYPLLVRKGLLYLTPHPGATPPAPPAYWSVRESVRESED